MLQGDVFRIQSSNYDGIKAINYSQKSLPS